MLCPQEKSGTRLSHDFSEFSIVTFGYSLYSPAYHNVTAHGFASMRELCCKLREMGHKSIGFIYSMESEARSLGSWIGGLCAAYALESEKLPVPPLAYDGQTGNILMKWFSRYKPDALISISPEPLNELKKRKVDIPGKISACLTVARYDLGIGGMDFDHKKIGAIAARKLIGLYHDRERGIPEQAEVTAITGQFWPGNTVLTRS